MDLLTIIYFAYAFISLYFLFLFLLVYIQNKDKMMHSPNYKRQYSLSMVVPCYNEESTIEETVTSLLNSDYPGLERIYVVDDCSTDNSYSIMKRLAQKYGKVIALQTPKNTGKASGPKNYGARFVTTELIGFTDADSYPDKDAISKAVGFFDNQEIAGVTSLILAKHGNNLIERLQEIEYKVIAFTRKLLGFLDAIYVMPGPLVIYRKSAFDKVGGFDEKNLTEDIEITWNLASNGYKVEMSMPSRVVTVVPNKIKQWYRQRVRWNLGGIQTIIKYKSLFMKKGIFGSFILPFFIFSWLLGLFGLGLMAYNFLRRLIVQYISTTYSIGAQTAILTMRDINLSPNVLFFFGFVLFFLGLAFTIFVLVFLREKEFKSMNLFDIGLYTLVYLSVYPIIMIASSYKFLRGKNSW